jgi:hypothetical protein
MSLSITSLTFDKSAYNPGDVITLTVDYTSDDATSGAESVFNASVTITDAVNTATGSAPLTVDATGAAQPTTVSASDDRSPSGTWTLVSNDLTGTAAPFAGVAVLTSAA